MQPTVLSLFAGIGGMELGLERAGMTTVGQVEIDPYCQRVLARHWPEVPRHDDVRTAADWWLGGPRPRVDVICGGYPCPAFSQAARGRNVAPNLWPLMRDVIARLRPSHVLLENVAAHLGRGFRDVLNDLAGLGFDVEWSIVPACALGAAHTRRRLFAVAYTNRYGQPAGPLDAQASRLPSLAGRRRGWPQPAPTDAREDDGLPYRVERTRALGNAVVPAVTEHIGRLIIEDIHWRQTVVA